MKIYELLPDIFGEHTATLSDALPDGLSFRRGAIISASDLPTTMEFSTGHTATDPPRGLLGIDVPVMSDEMLSVLARAGVSNLQTHPAVLTSLSDNKTWHSYKAVNIVGLVACADLERSIYTTIIARPGLGTPPLLGFVDLKVDPSRAGGPLLFRLAESPGIVLLDEVVARALLADRTEEEWGITVTERT